MQATTNGTMDVGNDSSRLAVSAGEKITLSAYGRTAREIRVAARFYNASGAFLSREDAGSVAGSTTEWRRAQGTVTVPAGAASIGWEVRFVGVTTGEVAFADAVQVERGDYAFGYSPHRDEVPQFERSGVTGMELLVGGTQRASASWTCPGHSCARSHTLNFATNALGEGRHSAQVRVTDGVGRSTQSQPWDVVVDHSAPRITRLEGALRQSFVGPGTFGLLLEATDQGNDAPVANLIPSSSFERRLPDGTQAADATIAAEATTAADGARALKVTADRRRAARVQRRQPDPGRRGRAAHARRLGALGRRRRAVRRRPALVRRRRPADRRHAHDRAAGARVDAPQPDRHRARQRRHARLAGQLQRPGGRARSPSSTPCSSSAGRPSPATTAAPTSSPRPPALRRDDDRARHRAGRRQRAPRAAQHLDLRGRQLRAVRPPAPEHRRPGRGPPPADRARRRPGRRHGRQRPVGHDRRPQRSAGHHDRQRRWARATRRASRRPTARPRRRRPSARASCGSSSSRATTACPARRSSRATCRRRSARTAAAAATPPSGSPTLSQRDDDPRRRHRPGRQPDDARGRGRGRRPAPPNLTLSGTLVAAQGMTLVEGAYDLEARATDTGSGMGSIEILLRRNGDALFTRQDYREQPCANGGCPMTRRWVFRPQAHTPGDYTVRVIARDLARQRHDARPPGQGRLDLLRRRALARPRGVLELRHHADRRRNRRPRRHRHRQPRVAQHAGRQPRPRPVVGPQPHLQLAGTRRPTTTRTASTTRPAPASRSASPA